MTEEGIRALATRFFDAIERADIESVRAIYADDVRVHHLAEDSVTTKEENLARLRMSTATWPNRRYVERDLRVCEGGFVQRHVLVREHRGAALAAPACIVCDVADDRITALYEYFDVAQLAAWRRAD